MNILVIGAAGREHALVKKLKRSTLLPNLFCYGPYLNPGIAYYCTQYAIGSLTDVATIGNYAKEWRIDLVVVGPEAPLEVGIADHLALLGIPVIGPKKQLAQIETSKSFARHFMQFHRLSGVPFYSRFTQMEGVLPFLHSLGDRYVIKADGLMSGKGVKVAGEHLFSHQEALHYCEQLLQQQAAFLIEEKLIGQEFSLMCFSDGKSVVPMPLVQDHKRAFENDEGPNTGGMGSYSDYNHALPFLTAAEIKTALDINTKLIKALHEHFGEPFIGILYGSFIATANGIYVIEFNARFGDPEILNVLSILESDLLTIFCEMSSASLNVNNVRFAKLATVCKYIAPQGYPDHPIQNAKLQLHFTPEDVHLYFAGLKETDQGYIATGARTAAFVGVGATLAEAHAAVESEIAHITGPFYHRKDIGMQGVIDKKILSMQLLRSRKCA